MFGSIFAQKVSTDEKWETMLVNEKHYVGRDYIPKLTELSNGEKYVGIDAAKTIKKGNLCLEEYLEKYK